MNTGIYNTRVLNENKATDFASGTTSSRKTTISRTNSTLFTTILCKCKVAGDEAEEDDNSSFIVTENSDDELSGGAGPTPEESSFQMLFIATISRKRTTVV